MKRRWFAVFGAALLVAAAVVAVLFGRTVLETPLVAVGLGTWVLAGVTSILGGLRESVGGIPWFRFVGSSDVLIGLLILGNGVLTYHGGPTDRVLLVTAVGGMTLVLIGFGWFCGGGPFDLAAYEPGPIFGESS